MRYDHFTFTGSIATGAETDTSSHPSTKFRESIQVKNKILSRFLDNERYGNNKLIISMFNFYVGLFALLIQSFFKP